MEPGGLPKIIEKMIPNRYKCVLGGHLALSRAHAYMGHLAFDAFGAEYGAPWTHFGPIRAIWGASLGPAASKEEPQNRLFRHQGIEKQEKMRSGRCA